MQVFNALIQLFGIDLLSSTSSTIDLINLIFEISVAIFIVSTFIRALFAFTRRV